ncbi:Inosine-5'-monophosphate dehydrogenase [Methanocorpusculaceae archaeon Sp1]|uniref:Inosine-5'-monophosphate dehydrogenase n=1 Tax=Methanorbis furvi TaxID=3028299 RepID=A0AAE4MCS5_9EURY|nr:Inosine-5'-monophosphate dehydrogenase [Methanocorpusculaceae archaeon Sp1]MDV0442510.1 Inosine-5'-monophosphate dehydrogenase [Methanocorpusculaceae archaeon Ag1]
MRTNTEIPDNRRGIRLNDIMQPNPTTISMGSTTDKAAALMCRNEVGSCIVTQKGIPKGIVTEQDFNCKVMAKNLLPGSVRVEDVMSSPLITVSEDMPVSEAAKKMIAHKVRRLPVTNAEGTVTGIVTVRDLLGVTNEINEIMSELLVINRPDDRFGMCAVCGAMAADLMPIDGNLVCQNCREQERI